MMVYIAVSLLYSPTSYAFSFGMKDGADAAKGVDQAADLFGTGGIFTTITNVLLFLIGAISVIMIVIGGLRYVISGGDASKVSGAKNTILYAIVGLIVALLAFAIINFVIGSFVPGSGGGGTDV
jgi:hypothetical protein